MIPWSLGNRAQYEKTTVPQSSQERNQDIMIPWSLGIRAQYEKTTVPQSSREESGHYDPLEPGYQSDQEMKAIMTIMSNPL